MKFSYLAEQMKKKMYLKGNPEKVYKWNLLGLIT